MLIRRRPDALRLCALVFALVAGLAVALGATLSAAQAAPVGKLAQFKVPTPNSQPRHIAVGSDGNLWFTEGNEVFTPGPDPDGGGTFHRNIGKITPAGAITEFRIEQGIGPTQCFCLLNDIVQGPNNILYFTTNNPGLGRITTGGQILPFVAPVDEQGEPITSAIGNGIAAHGDDIWYADFNNDSLWRYDTTGPDTGFTQFPVPEPSDVAVDEAGIVWFAATSDQAIGRLDPATGNATLTPTVNLVPRGIAVASDGDVWFTARFVPQGVGELDPDTNAVREFPLPDNPGPQDIAGSPDGSVWFTQTTEGNIARITDSGVVTEGKVVKNSEPFGITVASNGNPWYAMMSANKIARLTPN